jgi:hypothetical protein
VSSGKELAIRLAVGDPDGPRSTVWRVWANRRSSDVYVAARVLGGVAKVSLHQSGRWRFAFTTEFDIKQAVGKGGSSPHRDAAAPGEAREEPWSGTP